MEENLKNEKWVDIKGFEGFYQISNLGRIRSLDRFIEQRDAQGRTYQRKMNGKLLSLKRSNGHGYINVTLNKGCKSKRGKNYYIHILVAENFIPNIENKSEVNHKDGNKKNNSIDNLEWVTRKENMEHAFENGLNKWLIYKEYESPKGSKC